MGGIYWLASYPKSGNTWLRVFLTNYWRDADAPADINALAAVRIASDRAVFDTLMGVAAADCTPEEIDRYRPQVYEHLTAHSERPLYLKVHDAFTDNAAGVPILSKRATAGAVYLIRNPLDVAVSYAHYRNDSVATTVELMCRDDHALASTPGRLYNQLGQKLLSWSSHVCSWVDEPELNVHVVRYEDMQRAPVQTFTGVVQFLGWEVEATRLAKALEFSRFERLQAQEHAHGFRERDHDAKTFFRKGEIGSWRASLSDACVAHLIQAHRAVMRRFGYLTAEDEPIF